MIIASLGKPELTEDVLNVLLDRALGNVERSGDSMIGAALGHKGEDLPFAGSKYGESPVASAAGEELTYYFGI